MANKDIITFLKNNIQPLNDESFGLQYRVSATLKDGTFLPCVVFRNPSQFINRVVQTLTYEQANNSEPSALRYQEIIKPFLTNGNRINNYDIAKVEKSRFAFPLDIHHQIKGETSMGWTAFVARFKDGRCLSFGTSWNLEFFDLPDGFELNDVVEIINHSYLLKSGENIRHDSFDRITRKEEMEKMHLDRPFFECYTEDL